MKNNKLHNLTKENLESLGAQLVWGSAKVHWYDYEIVLDINDDFRKYIHVQLKPDTVYVSLREETFLGIHVDKTDLVVVFNIDLVGMLTYQYLLNLKTVLTVAKKNQEDYVMMPKRLTNDNGSKALMIGAFYEEKEVENPEYCGCGDCHFCVEFDTPQQVIEKTFISWTTIKDIYNKLVNFHTKIN